ncbi:NifB/NifX family molybdenum-iron cluster-binding protein [Clostridium senegalense]|uniref:NifB/NifX family molybdenum-iron cluster-binding protein n=1 Tax=Clostridium senegalense TaxID=1465809 RepID=UPI0002887382|nr:NifB/NifX family molybdenum-iron cluster-binding protein [Clostridium senegalense]
MKIAMPKNGEYINQHFGKSECFFIADLDGSNIKECKEISSKDLQHNHGGLSQLLVNEGVSVVITGGIGQGAYNALKEKGLDVIRGVNGNVNDVISSFISGKLKDKKVLCNHHGEHHSN